MSEDFVNNITLSYLISKTQLQKLNKKMKQTKEEAMKTDRENYKQQIISIFMELLESNDRASVNVLEEVKNGFDYFVEKTIYHIKMQEIAEEREQIHKEQITVTKSASSCSNEDDIDRKDADDEYEESCEDQDEDEDEDEDDDEVCEDQDDDEKEQTPSKIVYKKHKQKMDWFDMVKNENKTSKILPKLNNH